MNKFKVGDRVRYTSRLMPTVFGKVGVVLEETSEGYDVRFDGDTTSSRFCWESSLEPAFESGRITIDLTGADWEPTDATRYFAQREGGTFDFGPTPEAALAALLKREKHKPS